VLVGEVLVGEVLVGAALGGAAVAQTQYAYADKLHGCTRMSASPWVMMPFGWPPPVKSNVPFALELDDVQSAHEYVLESATPTPLA